ncbi:hypothetical protein, partial [Roseobacter weihaiensis]|uniref:hypothetical protein n=1 Tax=Roseobacter weihaiensis TaxID=2763262 RepID=UPI001D0A6095
KSSAPLERSGGGDVRCHIDLRTLRGSHLINAEDDTCRLSIARLAWFAAIESSVLRMIKIA